MKILVVEDEKPLAKAISNKLEDSGFNAVTARTAEEAIKSLENEEAIDAVWLDHYLLGKDSGLEVLTYMKSDNDKYKNTPVFVVSNTATDKKVQNYLELGADKYFVKAETRLDEIIENIKEQVVNTK